MLKRIYVILSLCTASCIAMDADLLRMVTACQVKQLEQIPASTLTSHIKEITKELEGSSCSQALLEALEKQIGTRQVSQSLPMIPWHSKDPGIRNWGLKVHKKVINNLNKGSI